MNEAKLLKLIKMLAKDITDKQLQECDISREEFQSFLVEERVYLLCENVSEDEFERIKKLVSHIDPEWEKRDHLIASTVRYGGQKTYAFRLQMTRAEYEKICKISEPEFFEFE